MEPSMKFMGRVPTLTVFIIFSAILVALALHVTANMEIPVLLFLANLVCVFFPLLIVSYLAAGGYTVGGSVRLLLVGCASLIFGLTSLEAGTFVLFRDPNAAVTVHNTGALAAALFMVVGFFAGAIGYMPQAKTQRKEWIVALSYFCILLLTGLLALATTKELLPKFIIPGHGVSLIRQVVLGGGALLFGVSTLLSAYTHIRKRTDFTYWYSLGLMMITIGLLCVLFQTGVGTLTGWVGRISQYAGCIYLVVAVFHARRVAKETAQPLGFVIDGFFRAEHRLLMQSTADAIIAFRATGEIVEWNQAAFRLFGYHSEEVIGLRTMEEIIGESFRELVTEGEGGSQADQRQLALGRTRDIEVGTNDGTTVPCELTAGVIADNGGNRLYYTIIRDISDRKVLQAMSLRLMNRLDLSAVLGEILDRACELIDTPHAYFYLINDEQSYLEVVTARGFYKSIVGKRMKKGEHSSGRIWETGRRIVTEEYSRLPWKTPGRDHVHAWIGIPLKHGEDILGVFGLARLDEDHRVFTQQEISTMEQMALMASISIINARTDRELTTELARRKRMESVLQTLNQELEQRVKVRTVELTAQNEENRAMNEEMEAQNEEIKAMNETLAAQNAEIRAINEEIELLNQNLSGMNEELENRVAERTADLTAAHQELTAQYQELKQAQEFQRRAAEIQDVLRQITETALLSTSLDDLYTNAHRQIKRLMPAENFNIALVDQAAGQIIVPYCVDEEDVVPRRRPIGKGLTEYVLRMGRTIHVTPEELDRLRESGEFDLPFNTRIDYLGAPLFDSQGRAFGVISMFFMKETELFQAADTAVLSITATQVAMAIERKRAEEELRDTGDHLRKLIQYANAPIIVWNPEFIITRFNGAFERLSGYAADEVIGKPVSMLFAEGSWTEAVELIEQARGGMHWESVEISIRRKSGEVRVALWNSANIHAADGVTLTAVIAQGLDITERVRRELEIRRDAQLATRVQNALLSMPEPSEYLEITTIYKPFSYVGGDLYFLDWRYANSLLRGFLVDTTGHGLGTALHTASLHVLLREVNEFDLPLSDAMRWLNQRAGEYFDEATFAGALGFELDLQTRQLRWACAGVPEMWMATQEMQGSVKCPGMCLGIREEETFDTNSMPINVGDSLYFMTDGLSDLLTEKTLLPLDRYSEMISLLQTLSDSKERRDDATAICIRVRAFPHSLLRQDGWPRILRFSSYGDYQRLKGEIASILAEVTGLPHSLHEVVVNEALANAMECRDGVPRQHKARLRFNKVGNLLIVRIKTSRIGFAGNAILRRLRSQPEDMFSFGEDASMGRGIPLMLSIAHRMTYNSEGTELLLAWNL